MPPGTLTVRGVRGSIPVPGRSTLRYGGNTCCVELELATDHRLLLDCGSGLSSLEKALPRETAPRFDVFLTHYHTDHLLGLPLFAPLYSGGAQFTFHGFPVDGSGPQALLERFVAPPSFPVPLKDTASRKRYVMLTDDPVPIADVTVRSVPLSHPQGARGFRLDRGDRSVVLVTDHELGDAALDRGVLELARDADVLLHDAQYTASELESRHRGWGHSSWEGAVALAREAGVGRLVLFHHDPGRSDEALDAIQERARQVWPEVEVAREGSAFPL